MTTYVQQALVFFGSAVILVPIFRQLGLGSVLGYLIAGIAVGPHGIGFYTDAESIMHFAELGVVFLLFVIGLEIRPRKLWSMRQHLFRLGVFQVVLSSVVFTLIGSWFGLSFAAAAAIGLGLSLSSTAFAVQNLVEKNQFNTEFGRASFSILLTQDLIAIPALAVIPVLLSTGATGAPSLDRVAVGLGTIAVLVGAGRFLVRPTFRMIAGTRSREIFTAATLFIVLGVAAVMQSIGLSASLGTFIAGVLLADSEYRHEIEADLEPFKSLLMGLFFISVGMTVNLKMIAEAPFLVLGLSCAYLILKAALIYIVARGSGRDHENSKRTALTVAQGGEFAFVLFGIVTRAARELSDTIALLTIVITLSMALSPLVELIDERLLSRLKKQAERKFDEIKDEAPEVIIAGFGRFGQIFGRLLRAQNIPFVAVDHDSDQVDLVRRFGSTVYYGDASRRDLLETAGAAKAKYFILAIDDIALSLKTAETVKEFFPHLEIFARARNRGHVFDLMSIGVKNIKREVFDSSVEFTRALLERMGFATEKAGIIVEKFRRHDEIMLEEQFRVRDDDKMFVSVSKQSTAQLAHVLSDDLKQSHISR